MPDTPMNRKKSFQLIGVRFRDYKTRLYNKVVKKGKARPSRITDDQWREFCEHREKEEFKV